MSIDKDQTMKTQTSLVRTPCPKTLAGRLRIACATGLLPLLLLSLPAAVQAQFTYTTNNGAISITGYTGPGGSVTIPSTINKLPVTSIGDDAFDSYYTLTNIIIPNSVTNIGSWAFFGCGLTSLTIPNSVTRIGEGAFEFCSHLTSVTIGTNVTSIGNSAFQQCSGLTSLTVPGSVTSIGAGTFEYCSSLTGVTLSDNVTNIGDNAFQQCSSLTSFTIPSSVISIGEGAFEECAGLTNITVAALNPNYAGAAGVLFDKNLATLIAYPGGRTDSSYAIPGSVTSIGSYAFTASGLASVTIPTSVTNIEDHAFYACNSLTNLALPTGLTGIGDHAFAGCNKLTSLTIPGSVISIGDGAFNGCFGLTGIAVDASNLNYASDTGVLFDKNLATLIRCPEGKAGSYAVPSGVTNIGDGAFSMCTALAASPFPAASSASRAAHLRPAVQ